MKSYITIHIGGAATRIGSQCWELFLREVGIEPNGHRLSKQQLSKTAGEDFHYQTFDLESFFEVSKTKIYEPRAIFIDFDSKTIEQAISNSQYAKIYNHQSFITGKDSTGGCFARGRNMQGQKFLEECMQRIRFKVEKCDKLDGIVVLHALGGGTGSGFGSLLLQHLRKAYPKLFIMNFPIFSENLSSSTILTPYNSLLSMPSLIETCDATVCFSNQTIRRQCRIFYNLYKIDFHTINPMISQTISTLTLPSRDQNPVSLSELFNPIIPFPKLHFLMPSYYPFGVDKDYRNKYEEPRETDQLSTSYLLAGESYGNDTLIACQFMFRGDVYGREITDIIAKWKKQTKLQFIPNSFHLGLRGNRRKPIPIPNSILGCPQKLTCGLFNSNFASSLFRSYSYDFHTMYGKHAYVHWFLKQGMRDLDFIEAQEATKSLMKDYEEITKMKPEESDEEQG